MGNNRIPLLPPGLFAEEFKSFLHAGFENNYIASVPYKLLSSLADVNQFTLNVDENVLVCNDFVAAGAQSCKCNGAHAQYEQTASVFDDTDTSSGNAQVRVCRIGATTISHLEAISQVMTDMKASIDSIKARHLSPHHFHPHVLFAPTCSEYGVISVTTCALPCT